MAEVAGKRQVEGKQSIGACHQLVIRGAKKRKRKRNVEGLAVDVVLRKVGAGALRAGQDGRRQKAGARRRVDGNHTILRCAGINIGDLCLQGDTGRIAAVNYGIFLASEIEALL